MLFTRTLFISPLLALTLTAVAANAQPTNTVPAPADFKVPAAEMQQWAQRLSKLYPAEGWTVKAEGNEVNIQFNKPVMFYQNRFRPEISRARKNLTDYEGTLRLTVRFSPLMSLSRYNELSELNYATYLERQALLRKHHLSDVGGVLNAGGYGGPTTSEGVEAEKRAYKAASEKLKFHSVPQYFTPDYSVGVVRSWSQYETPYFGDEKIDNHWREISQALPNYFASYSRLNSPVRVGKE